jgi:hypothetical protein
MGTSNGISYTADCGPRIRLIKLKFGQRLIQRNVDLQMFIAPVGLFAKLLTKDAQGVRQPKRYLGNVGDHNEENQHCA